MTAPAPEAAVTMTDAEFRYGSTAALREVSLSLSRGTATALLGPNGAGKSTLLNGIAGLIPPHSGKVTVHYHPGVRRRVAYVLQNVKANEALPVTVREVVQMGRYAGCITWWRTGDRDREAVTEAMERTGVVHLARRPFSHLSGGERQRVLLAQGLAAGLDILLLDEPGAGLDLQSLAAIREVIRQETERGGTVVFATHHLDEARAADNVILLAGRVVAAGPPRSVLTVENMTAAYQRELVEVAPGHHLLDDSHHQQADPSHSHERSIHLEPDPADVHHRPDDHGHH